MFTTAQQRADRRANTPIYVMLILLSALIGLAVWLIYLPGEMASRISIPRILWFYITNPSYRALINAEHLLAPLWVCVTVPAALVPIAVAGAFKHFDKKGA